MKNLKIGTRLGLGFLFVLVLTLGIGATGALQSMRIYDELDYYVVNTTPSLEAVNSWSRHADEIRMLQAKHILVNSDAEMTSLEAEIQRSGGKLQQAVADYEKMLSNEEDRRLWEAVKARSHAYFAGWEKLKAISCQTLTDPSKVEEAEKLFGGFSEQEHRALSGAIAAE